jgi:hypothetical protein
MIYELHHVGGPADGEMTYAIRPYFRLKHPDKAVYQARMEGGHPIIDWVDDETRSITMYFEGFWPAVPDPD